MPSTVAQYVLENFSGDGEIEASLYGELTSGAWTGPESARLAGQIATLRGWKQNASLHLNVREWAQKIAVHLEDQRAQILEREAERGY